MTLEEINLRTLREFARNTRGKSREEIILAVNAWEIQTTNALEHLLKIHFDTLLYKRMPCKCVQCVFIRKLLGA